MRWPAGGSEDGDNCDGDEKVIALRLATRNLDENRYCVKSYHEKQTDNYFFPQLQGSLAESSPPLRCLIAHLTLAHRCSLSLVFGNTEIQMAVQRSSQLLNCSPHTSLASPHSLAPPRGFHPAPAISLTLRCLSPPRSCNPSTPPSSWHRGPSQPSSPSRPHWDSPRSRSTSPP